MRGGGNDEETVCKKDEDGEKKAHGRPRVRWKNKNKYNLTINLLFSSLLR